MFVEGKGMMAIALIATVALMYLLRSYARQGKTWYLHKLPGLNAIDEGIGRAVEQGRPVHFSMGIVSGGAGDPDRSASWPLLSYVSRKCAEVGCRLIATVGRADSLPVLESIVSEAAIAAGNPEWYVPTDVRYLGEDQYVYIGGVMGILQREKVSFNLIFGQQRGALVSMIEAGRMSDTFQIGGMARRSGELGFMALCDYSFLLDEVPAAAAYVSGDSQLIATTVVGDYAKFVILIILILGALLSTANINVITNLMGM